MKTDQRPDLFDDLRSRGVRRKVAKPIAGLEGNRRRHGAAGEQRAREAASDLEAAAAAIRKRVLRTDPKRTKAGKKAAKSRQRSATKRSVAAKKSAKTRAKKTARRTTKL